MVKKLYPSSTNTFTYMLKSSNPKTHVLNLRSRDRSKKIGQLNHKGSNQPKPTHTRYTESKHCHRGWSKINRWYKSEKQGMNLSSSWHKATHMLTVPCFRIKSSTNDFPYHKRVIILHQLPSTVIVNNARPAGNDMISDDPKATYS